MSTIGEIGSGPTTHLREGRSTGWWGMVGLMATEGTLFGLLLFTYWYFEAGLTDWPPGNLPSPELKVSGIRSVILLASTIPMIIAEKYLEKGRTAAFNVWWAFGIALGTIFFIGHVQEQPKLWHELAPQETAYGSAFMTIINFHGAHLLIGIVIALVVLVHGLRGRFTPENSDMVAIAGMYWHFVDVIWIFVYSTLYLSPHLLS